MKQSLSQFLSFTCSFLHMFKHSFIHSNTLSHIHYFILYKHSYNSLSYFYSFTLSLFALLYFWPLVQAWFFQLNSHMWTPYLAPSCKFRSPSERGGVFKYGRLTRNSFEGGLSQYWIWDGYWISYHLYHHHHHRDFHLFLRRWHPLHDHIAWWCDFYWKFYQNVKLESPLYCAMLIFITLIHHPRSKYSYMCVLTGGKSKSFIA